MRETSIVLIQPWFSALGHPAQSALNFSRVFPRSNVRAFLISSTGGSPVLDEIASSIRTRLPLHTFKTPWDTLRFNTVVAALKAGKFVRRQGSGISAAFYIDGDLLAACLLLLFGIFRPYGVVYIVYLGGPEAVSTNFIKRTIIRRALLSRKLRILLRTPELLKDWVAQYSDVRHALGLLPPVEAVLPGDMPTHDLPRVGALRIGVIGQVRIGKCIPSLIEACDRSAGSMSVSVHGPLYEHQPPEFLRLMRTHARVHLGFLSEEKMLKIAAEQDYIACLFEEEFWDLRMESGTFWLAVKALKPVLCFGAGWVGKMVRETGCGIILQDRKAGSLGLDDIPCRDATEYERCLKGLRRLQAELVPEILWEKVQGIMGQ